MQIKVFLKPFMIVKRIQASFLAAEKIFPLIFLSLSAIWSRIFILLMHNLIDKNFKDLEDLVITI